MKARSVDASGDDRSAGPYFFFLRLKQNREKQSMASTHEQALDLPISDLLQVMMEGGKADKKTVDDLIKQIEKAKKSVPCRSPQKQTLESCSRWTRRKPRSFGSKTTTSTAPTSR